MRKLPWDMSHGARWDRNGHKVAQNDGVGLIWASFIGCPRVPVFWCPHVLVSRAFPSTEPGSSLGWDERQQGHGGMWQGPWDPQEALVVPCGCWCISRAWTEGASILFYSVIL